MFGAEENDADPAQIKQLHLVIVSPVDLDHSHLPQVFVGQDGVFVKLSMEELDTLPDKKQNTCTVSVAAKPRGGQNTNIRSSPANCTYFELPRSSASKSLNDLMYSLSLH